MTPYYQDDFATIYHADCRSVALARPFDVIITDPPYGTGLYPSDTDVFDADMLATFVSFSPTLVFGWPERLVALCIESGLVPNEWLTWWPSNAACRGFNPLGLWREAECIAAFGEFAWMGLRRKRSESSQQIAENVGIQTSGDQRIPTNPSVGARMGDVWTDPAPGLGFNSHQRLHPNEKPLGVMARLVSVSGGIVMDPFMGSGTTLRAAKDLARKAIGIEIEERYCEIAAKRLAQEVLDFGGVA